jgi:hypothetical protein
MKKNYIVLFLVISSFLLEKNLNAQCAALQNGGSATNMFTLIRNSNSSIAANKALNTVVFIHRNNVSSFGGSSGKLRFDYSTNGGTNWTNDQGVVNPLETFSARYPNVAIYNPSANTNTANAYLSYMAPTFSGGAVWNGEVTGVSRLNVTGVTENYNQNGIGTTWQASSLVNGAPGVFWAIDPLTSGTGFVIYKGVWNSGSSDIIWNINYTVSPTMYTPLSLIELDFNIAFDPTGQTGYFCFAGHVNPGPTNAALYPILYKTIDGGVNWTGPITVDISQLSCITSNSVSSYLPSMSRGSDLVVDVNGNPHIIATVGSASAYVFNYNAWHHMYDITLKNGLWVAHDMGNVNGAPNIFGTGANVGTQYQAPQAARSADGTKVFFTWTDNSSYSLGALNNSPNLFGKGFNVSNNTWTPTKDFTSCNSAVAGKVLFPHLAEEVLEPNSTTYKLATIYGVPSTTNDLGVVADFKFLDNVTFATSEFSISVPPATVTIPQGPNVLVCPGTSLNLSVSNAGQVLWSTGSTVTPLSISTSSLTSYSVIAQVGCLVGTASVAVSNMSFNAVSTIPSVCPGFPATFTVAGNALSYTWMPGTQTGTNVVLNPTANTVTVMASGSASCVSTQTIGINILTPPVISISGNTVVCAGRTLTQTASGAQTYIWDNSASGATFTDTPLVNTSYTVTGTAVNTCTNTQTVSVVVIPSPTISAIISGSAVCVGGTIAIIGSGGVTYSLNGSTSNPNFTIAPSASSIYTLTGAGTNLCQTDYLIPVTVYALPSISVTPTKTLFCKGEKTKLTASGASTYTWTNIGAISVSITVQPSVTTTYSVIGTSTAGCINTIAYTLQVSECTGIGENNPENVSLVLYPNPNNGVFTLKADADLHLKLLNELGQVVRVISLTEFNEYTVEVADLSSGIYFLTGINEGLSIKQKIIVNK